MEDVCEIIKELHLRSHRNCPETSKKKLNDIKSHNWPGLVKGVSKCPSETGFLPQGQGVLSMPLSSQKESTGSESFVYINPLDIHDSEKENICKCEYDDCILVVERDWMWIAAIKV